MIWAILTPQLLVAQGNVQLPTFSFVTPGGEEIASSYFENDRPLIVIYFEPTCIHCELQAEWLANRINDFNHIDLLFVAWEPTNEIPDFRDRFFPQVENVYFAMDGDQEFDQLFGFSQIPTIYVYDDSNQLKKKFKKETKAERLLKALE